MSEQTKNCIKAILFGILISLTGSLLLMVFGIISWPSPIIFKIGCAVHVIVFFSLVWTMTKND